jgi:heat shock protein 5
MASSLSILLVAVLALILLCPVAVKADEDKKSEYGTVIGIGTWLEHSYSSILTCNSDLGTTYSCVGYSWFIKLVET